MKKGGWLTSLEASNSPCTKHLSTSFSSSIASCKGWVIPWASHSGMLGGKTTLISTKYSGPQWQARTLSTPVMKGEKVSALYVIKLMNSEGAEMHARWARLPERKSQIIVDNWTKWNITDDEQCQSKTQAQALPKWLPPSDQSSKWARTF